MPTRSPRGSSKALPWTITRGSSATASFWCRSFRTLIFAVVFTFCTLILTYPVAYFLARHVSPARTRCCCLLLLLIPFWVGEIVRTYAIMILLGNHRRGETWCSRRSA